MPGAAMSRRRPIRAMDISHRAVTLAVIMLLADMMAPIALCPISQAGSTWTTAGEDDFNATGSSYKSTVLIGTGPLGGIALGRGGNWSRANPAEAPPRRVDCPMAAIGDGGELLLFGGIDIGHHLLNDTWVYDSVTDRWAQRFPVNSPSARWSAMARIFGDDKVVLFGGLCSFLWPRQPSNETWVFDMSENGWHNMSPVPMPPGRSYHAMAPVWNTDKVILFGGVDRDGYYLNDSWIYDAGHNSWARVDTMFYPSARCGHAMATVPGDDKVVLFGGIASDGLRSDTWVFDISENRWTYANAQNWPQAREGAMMSPAYQANGSVILFGGNSGNNAFSDTWSYDCIENSWRFISAGSSPGGHKYAGMDSVPNSSKVVLFGGDMGTSNYNPTNATWIFNASAYYGMGDYISAPFNTGGPSDFKTVRWNATLPEGTFIELQLRTSSSEDGLLGLYFSGPDGTGGTWYSNNSTIWQGHVGAEWLQYKARLRTENVSVTPVLEEISIFYDRIPGPPVLVWPPEAGWFSSGSQPFIWSLNDSDSPVQNGFEWQLNQFPDEGSNLYTTGPVFAEGTNFTPSFQIPTGTWYWRVRTETEGEWGPFSEFRKMGVEYTPPDPFTAMADPGSWTNGPVEISYFAHDDLSGIDTYKVWVDGEPCGDQASPFLFQNLVDGVHEVVVRAYDRAGNYAKSSVKVYMDMTPPEPFRPTAASLWSRNAPQIMFSAQDAWSGVDHYEVSVEQRPFGIVSSPFTLTDMTEGEHAVVVWAVDRAGNIREANITVGYDTVGPHIRLFSVSPPGWTDADPTATFSAQDDLSGMDRFEMSIDNGLFSACASPLTLAGLAEGRHGITLRALDRAGNRAEQNLQVQIDRTPPEEFMPIARPANWTSQDPVLSFEAQDDLSGVDRYDVQIDGGEPVSTDSPTILEGLPEGTHLVTVNAYDMAGNHRMGNVSVFIDRSPPVSVTVRFLNADNVTSSRDMVLSIAAADNLSGLDRMCFSSDGYIYSGWEPFGHAKKWSLSPGNGRKTVYVKVRDKAGNEAPPVHAKIYLKDLTSTGLSGAPAVVGAIAVVILAAAGIDIWLRMRARKMK